jgi:signal transduction histidine kinase
MDASPDEPVHEAVHLLARNYDALDDTVRRLLLMDGDQEALPFGAASIDKGSSLYNLLNQRLQMRRLTPSQVARVLSLVLRELDRHHSVLLNLIESQKRHEPLSLRRRVVDLHALLVEIVEVFEGPAAEKGVELRLNLRGNPELLADQHLLYRMFMNIIDNAVKYSFSRTDHSSRHVDIQCRRHTMDGQWLVTIESYGVGILPHEISSGRIFQYGQRGELARDRNRVGSGIGLSESKRIAEAHGGSLKIDSRPLNAAYITTVSIQLPEGAR